MHFIAIAIGTILLSVNYNLAVNNKLCYIARICIHKGNEKCGIDSNGNVRRFIDTCDLLEYNCLYDTDFTKTEKCKCDKLPPMVIEEQQSNEKLTMKLEKENTTQSHE